MDTGDAPGARRLVARVLLESSVPWLDQLFDYAVPEDMVAKLKVGQRVRVPLRSKERKNFGWVIELSETTEFSGKLSNISEIVTEIPLLTQDVWKLARTVADRAAGSACDILRLAIPKRYIRAEKVFLMEQAESAKLDTKKYKTSVTDKESDTVEKKITELLKQGEKLSYVESHSPVRLDNGQWTLKWAVRSAKIAEQVLAAGKSMILCVPDYRDINILQSALEEYKVPFVRADAGQSGSDRYLGFLSCLEQTPRIIIGTRSAIYYPAFNLGAIALWDDGDQSFNEPLAPYVNCRDAALIRAEQQECGLLFMGYTRSLEVQRLIEIGYLRGQQDAPFRVKIRHADNAAVPDEFAGRMPVFALQMIREGLKKGPVLAQVGRSGYATSVSCVRCNELATCAECSGVLYFKQADVLSCRICGIQVPMWQCDVCGCRQNRSMGAGSRLTAEHFQKQFPGVRVVVSDGDSPLTLVDSRPAIVVATPGAEPLAAGGYRTVVLFDGYKLLSIPTLNAEQNCLRLWHNAAALTAVDGVCVVAQGSGSMVKSFISGTDNYWLQEELLERAQLKFPPAVRTANITGGMTQIQLAKESLKSIADCDVLGPVRDSEESFRMIARFPYKAGDIVAKQLRGAVLKQAAGSVSRARARTYVPKNINLRVKFDDRGVFDDFVEEE